MTTTTEVTRADVLRELDRAIDRIMNIQTEAMDGDNLAVALCSHFEDPDDDGEQDDSGWHPSAIKAYDEIRVGIAGLFVPVRDAIAAHRAQALAQGRLEGIEAGLEAAEKEAQSVILQARMGKIDNDLRCISRILSGEIRALSAQTIANQIGEK